MILDSMTKYEVMTSLRKEFKEEVMSKYLKDIRPLFGRSIRQKKLKDNRIVDGGIDEIKTSQNNVFQIIKRGTRELDLTKIICQFRWRGKKCFAEFSSDNKVIVYQDHCLQRYAERVLEKNLDDNTVFMDYVLSNGVAAFNIVLPTPTHPYSLYYGVGDALFLGDFDDQHATIPNFWLNTCISLKEAHYSQSKILNSLWQLQTFVKNVREDLTVPEVEEELQAYLKKWKFNAKKINELKNLFILKFLMLKLYLSFDFSFTEEMREEIDANINHIENYLRYFNLNPDYMSPYDPIHGVAFKGEIDYRGH